MRNAKRGRDRLSQPVNHFLILAAALFITAFIPQPVQAQLYHETVLHTFRGGPNDTTHPYTLIRDNKGNLYGDVLFASPGAIFKLDPSGKETVSFLPDYIGNPIGSLIRDSEGNLYDTGDSGCGSIFEIGGGGKLHVLHRFSDNLQNPDGCYPDSLLRDEKGNLYGTTGFGGDYSCFDGCGVVFKLNPQRRFSVLYRFKGGGTGAIDGAIPVGGMVRDEDGNLYGMTNIGGAFCPPDGCGTVFKLDADGHESVFYSFAGGDDGAFPEANLVRDAEGNLYGTTAAGGGSTACIQGCGTVFKIDPNGKETVLHRFSAGLDGFAPNGLTRDDADNLYGSAASGNDSYRYTCIPLADACGLVYKVDPNGNETILYRFTGGADGGIPFGPPVTDDQGNLYGTTNYGGDLSCLQQPPYEGGCGVVYKLTP